jgi:PHD/YefM family antitoxin component YafN of YafNO toxin-antitoxin module
VKKHSVRVRILKPYKSTHVNFLPGEIVWVTQKLADELILADAAEYPEEQIDIEIERITAANPEAIRKLNAKLDADTAAGRCQEGGFAIEEDEE